MRFVLEKFNQAEKLDDNAKNLKSNLSGNNISENKSAGVFSSANKDKDKDPLEDEYNDFEENISVESNNWK